MAQISANGQFTTQYPVKSERQFSTGNTSTSQPKSEAEPRDDRVLATRIVAALRRLDDDVLVYRSLGDFEADGRLARVHFEVFKDDLQDVIAEVEPMPSQLPQSKLKIEISNALASYQDGEFWWQKIHQPRVVSISAMSFVETTRTPSDTVLLSTIPHTVVIHWKQAGNYLKRAEELMNQKK